MLLLLTTVMMEVVVTSVMTLMCWQCTAESV